MGQNPAMRWAEEEVGTATSDSKLEGANESESYSLLLKFWRSYCMFV